MRCFKKRKLNMDANSIISAFISSSNQYIVTKNENNLMQLQRHLEILVCLTTSSSDLAFFQCGNSLASQCITHIVNLLLDSNAKYSLIPRVLSILQNLSKCSQLNKNLKSVFHVHAAVSVFLQQYGMDVKDPLVLQCLDLLETVTYDINIDYLESHFENLIDFLLKLIDSDSLQLLKTALKILTNLTRCNVSVQNYICSLPNARQTIKKIVSILRQYEESNILCYALFILANLTLKYSEVAKLWTEEHLILTFQMIMKLIFGSDVTCAIPALDLFLDLMKVSKFQISFIKSPYLNTFLKRIPRVLKDDTSEQSVVYLQILYALIKIPECSKKVCSVLCVPAEKNDVDSDSHIKIHPKIIDWCVKTDSSNENAQKMSLKLLKCILSVNIVTNFSAIEESSKEVLKSILSNMTVPLLSELSMFEKLIEIHTSIFEILILLLSKTDMKQFISQHLNTKVCEELAQMLLEKSNVDELENSLNCVHLFLMILEVILVTECSFPEFEENVTKILNNIKAMQFLACAITSNNNDYVKRGLLLIRFMKNEFTLNELSKNLLARNMSNQKRSTLNSEVLDSSFISDAGYSAKKPEHLNNAIEKNIDSLLLKIEQGLSIKELKRSEIMELYEHKIAGLTRKEQELQNYIEAKTAALQKADRIMTQYKCRQADLDAEALRLRTMLKNFESQCERATLKFEEAERESKRQKEELDIAECKIKELKQYQKEQQDLMQVQMSRQYEQKKCHEEEKARFSELLNLKDSEKKALMSQIQQLEEDMKLKCRAYEVLEESRDELMKQNEEMKKFTERIKQNFEQKIQQLGNVIESNQQVILELETKNEKLMNQMNEASEESKEQILQLENIKAELEEQLKIKDSKVADLNETIRKANLQISQKSKMLQETEISKDKLQTVLEKVESDCDKLKQDVKMLEMLCKRYEASLEKKDLEIKDAKDELDNVRRKCEGEIGEKDSQIKHLEAELEKQKYITGMIHQIASGVIPPPTTKPDK